jgi:hypothetical protein
MSIWRNTFIQFFAVFSVAALISLFKSEGVCWVAGREPVTEEHIQSLVENNVAWISQTPFGWQRKADSASIHFITKASTEKERGVMWGESDEGLIETTKLAKEKGIKTLLKPHIWVHRSWPGEIEMPDEASWKKWFSDYEKFILHYAELAEQNQIELLCIGTELQKASRREADWRTLIQKIRTVYKGKLIYAANFHDEFEVIRFWDDLDYIGIQAYFSLSKNKNPNLAELTAGWSGPLSSIENIVRKYQKPVVFTEIGYRSTSDAAIEPWLWPQQMKDQAEPSEEIQSRCYEAFFKAAWKEKWLAGVYFWKWYPGGTTRMANIDFTPQGKAAEKVMAEHFKKYEERH